MVFDTIKQSATTAYAASLIARATPGKVHRVFGYNSGGAQFIQIHDAATLPADTGVPLVVIAVGATSNFDIDLRGLPLSCTAGIVISNSSTAPTKTIGSANCWINVQHSK